MMRLLITKYKKWKNNLHRLHIPQNYKNKDNFQKGSIYRLRDLQANIKHHFRSDQISGSVVSDSLWPHESQNARPPCPSPTPRVHSDSCPLSQWCHPAISSSVIPFSPAPNPSQHQSLFQWVNSLHEVAKVLEFQL